MKGAFRHIIALFGILLFSVLTAYRIEAQDVTNPYYLDGNEVVFVFDIRNYAKALKGDKAAQVDFADLRIYEVAVSGQFNNWNKKGWKMSRKGEFLFELRKNLADFNDAFPMDFRYVINGKYLANPDLSLSDPKNVSNNFLEDVYKLDLSVIDVTDQGKIQFNLRGHQDAKQVILSGSFNNWNEQAIHMKKTSEGWTLRANLPPGRYEYKFIADGEWLHDPASKENVTNQHGTLNSVLRVRVPVKFTLSGYSDAKQVILAGSFNNWNEHRQRMTLANGVWTTMIDLEGGKQHYKFIVDGQWITDPANPVVEDDGNGNLNSVLFVH
jgi:1,4-alpha-glucan branching enzyme